MKTIVLSAAVVGSGGFIGAVLRYALSGLVQTGAPLSAFPWATVVVNLLGCLLIGIVAGLIDARQLWAPEIRMFVLVGILGGFTTFSNLGYETFALLRDAEFSRAAAYVGIQVFVGVSLVFFGYALVSRWS